MNRLTKMLLVVVGTVVLQFGASSNRPASAQEPASTAKVILAMVEIAGIIDSLFGGNYEDQFQEINQKLDTLILGQQEIMEDLQDLRLYISEELRASFREQVERELIALKRRFDLAMTEQNESRRREKLEDLLGDIEHSNNVLAQFSPAAMPALSSGIALQFLTYDLVDSGDETRALAREQFACGAFERWLDPTNPRGLPSVRSATLDDIRQKTIQLESLPRSYVTRNWSDRGGYGGCITYYYQTVLTIKGNLAGGFTSESVTNVVDQRESGSPSCGGGGTRDLHSSADFPEPTIDLAAPYGNEILEADEDSVTMTESDSPILPAAPVPDATSSIEFRTSGVPQLDNFNRLRHEIYSLAEIYNRQGELVSHAKTLRRQLMSAVDECHMQ